MTAAQFDPEAWDAEADLFDDVDPTAEARSLAEAEADVAAGRLISHERVSAWLMSLGTEKYLARPEPD